MGDSVDVVKLQPPEVLVFRLEKNCSPRAVLQIENTSTSRVIYKVKTTQPSWYYVRPNQSVIDVGAREEVAIALVDTECNRLIVDAAQDKKENVDKHRFLVQAKTISNEQYARLIGELKPAERAEEYNRLWEEGSAKSDRKMKLRVEFRYPDLLQRQASPAADKSLSRSDSAQNTGGSYEAVFTELQTLRKKYDAVVEYTVHLTAERDTIVAQLEEAKNSYAKDGRKPPASPSRKGDKAGEKRVQQGFSILSVAVVAVLCFLLGKYVKLY